MRRFFLATLATSCALLLAPAFAAAGTFEVSGWLPYWSGATSTSDVAPHLSDLTEIDPFAYVVQNDGSLVDAAGLQASPWSTLIAQAKAAKVRVIPTIMWSNASAEEAILSNTTKRIALENSIANLAKKYGYDGVEIDFENKPADLKDYFSTFLKGLYARMGQKWVMCDIEARTPVSSEYYGLEVPVGAGQYANDYTEINKYCDRVKLMTYDQQGVDNLLASEAASSSRLYAPVSDPAWIEAVVGLAEQSINKKKILIGIPTYGYEYDVTAYAGSQYVYSIMWPFNYRYALQIEQQYGVSASRALWGEEQLTYTANPSATSTPPADSAQPVTGGQPALVAAAAAALYATSYNSHIDFRYLVWPDAESIAEKAALAKSLGVRGIAIFKLDGGEDPGIWGVLQGVKK